MLPKRQQAVDSRQDKIRHTPKAVDSRRDRIRPAIALAFVAALWPLGCVPIDGKGGDGGVRGGDGIVMEDSELTVDNRPEVDADISLPIQ